MALRRALGLPLFWLLLLSGLGMPLYLVAMFTRDSIGNRLVWVAFALMLGNVALTFWADARLRWFRVHVESRVPGILGDYGLSATRNPLRNETAVLDRISHDPKVVGLDDLDPDAAFVHQYRASWLASAWTIGAATLLVLVGALLGIGLGG